MPIFTDLEELNSNTVTNVKSELTTPLCCIFLHSPCDIDLCDYFRCGLLLFYRHTNKDEKVTFIFPDMLVQSGEKPVTTEKPEVLDEAAAQKKRRKVLTS